MGTLSISIFSAINESFLRKICRINIFQEEPIGYDFDVSEYGPKVVMYRFWDAIIKPILEVVEPRQILEIGGGFGKHSRLLSNYCHRYGSKICLIDTVAQPEFIALAEENSDVFSFIQNTSLSAISEVPLPDIVMIDGDHNYYTVFNELLLLHKRFKQSLENFPLIFFHDVCWPYGRRDMYYDATNLPAKHIQSYSEQGIRPGVSELVESQGINFGICNALREGGERNGVLTAIEDFIKEFPSPLYFRLIPIVHGLGIMCPLSLLARNTKLNELLARLNYDSLIENLFNVVEDARNQGLIDYYALRHQHAVENAQAELRTTELETKKLQLEEQVTSLVQNRSILKTNHQALLGAKNDLEAKQYLLTREKETLEYEIALLNVEAEQKLENQKETYDLQLSELQKQLAEKNFLIKDLQQTLGVHEQSNLLLLTKCQQLRGTNFALKNSKYIKLVLLLKDIRTLLLSARHDKRRAFQLCYWMLTFRLKSRLMEEKKVKCLAESELFDYSYYRHQINASEESTESALIKHYLRQGANEGKKPHPLFDSRYYLNKYPDIKASGVNPFLHFIETGYRENRNPNPLFHLAYYNKQSVETAIENINPLLHYVKYGVEKHINPHPLFDSCYYLQKYKDVARAGLNPLAHYLMYGTQEMRKPNALFEPLFYLEQIGDDENYDHILNHYLETGAKDKLSPNPLFDGFYYLTKNPSLKKQGCITPLEDYLLNWRNSDGVSWIKDKRSPHPLFCNAFYLHDHPEVRKRGISPLFSYLEEGIAKDFLPNPFHLAPLSLIIRENLHYSRIAADLEAEARGINFTEYDSPCVSIVIPVYNKLEYTLRCLKSIYLTSNEHTPTYEIIVVDDQSTDQTEQILRKIANLRYIRNDENLGFVRSCNRGAEIARGEYILMLNNDTSVMPDWLATMVDTFLQQKNVGLVGSQLLYPSGRMQEAGGIIWPDATGWNWGCEQTPDDYQYNYLREVDYCSGACIMLPSILWKQLNGFDEYFIPAYYEDVDLAFRVRQAGLRTVYQPLSKVIHFEGVSCGKSTQGGVKSYQIANREKFAKRWSESLVEYSSKDDPTKSYLNRSKKKQILLIDTTTPTPDKDAGSDIVIQFIKIFQKLGFHVVIAPQNLAYVDRYTKDLQQMGVECVYRPFAVSIEDYLSKEGERFDIVMLYRASCANRFLETVRQCAPRAKIIYNTVDLHFLRMEREADVFGDMLVKVKARKMKEIEFGLMRKVEDTILLSEREQEMLKKDLPDVRTTFIPIVKEIPGLLAPFEQRRDVVFLGGFGHPPNIDAVKYLVNDIWPLVKPHLPEVKLVIVGSNMVPEIEELAGNDVIIRGYVANLDDVFREYRIMVAPLRYGAGMKGKVVTALSYAVPSVITSIAAEGMGLVHENQALIADEPQDFADQIIRLYVDEKLWDQLSTNGLLYARSKFSLEVAEGLIKNMLQEQCL
ncbi:MAG: glycosyltransferase [Deltaproteobacteria bacterium]|nr:glycosyltransferase [Deltaproteobacteria bacterium]